MILQSIEGMYHKMKGEKDLFKNRNSNLRAGIVTDLH